MVAVSAYARESVGCSFYVIIHIIDPAPRLAEPAARGIADEMQHFLHILVIREPTLGFFNPFT